MFGVVIIILAVAFFIFRGQAISLLFFLTLLGLGVYYFYGDVIQKYWNLSF